MNDETRQRIQQIYGVENWSAGYFDISPEGHLMVHPAKDDPRYVDLKVLVDDLLQVHKLSLPLLIRFPQLLTSQLRMLSEAYHTAITQYGFHGQHYPVFPMKVNPRREVVEEFLRDSSRCRVGLECGSKAELYAAIAQQQTPESLLLCNGFKDEAFIQTALLGVRAGKRVTIVVEKLNELKMIVKLSRRMGVAPWIGLRVKLYSRGSGKWAASGGDSSKFGLTTSELLECVRLLKQAGLDGQLKLLHFHIGSQITDIKRVKTAMKEAARVYAKLRQIDCGIEYLDIGGGLGVDYDGSRTRFESSVNYTVQEFANDVVYAIKAVCEDEHVPHPHLVTESGRFMTAYHTVFITSIRDEIETFADDEPEVTIDADDPQVIMELKDLCDGINGKNYTEFYHDALEHKDELHTQFNLGLISLEDRAKGEVLFWEACARALKESEENSFPAEEFEQLKKILAQKYLCNFSLFRSAPDSFAIRQLFPICPIHRLHEIPEDFATLVDVTCDSDGKIDRFVDLKDVKQTLELHPWKDGEDYYLGLFLTGAYQEVMGSYHNLFGQPNEAQVVIDTGGRYHVTKLISGSRISDMMQFARYSPAQLVESFRKQLTIRVEAGVLTKAMADQLATEYEAGAAQGTYLE
ncbi:MAG: biosynthetic arginine decarboxylase [Planctomycetales bacterium]|mgnify:CR=1 FL=1|nr:biosynthetic arginine decarboxylase [Planctomycetales bacterium]